MLVSKPIAVTDADFETQVLKADQPVLVDFWATWCGPCKMMAPVLDQLASETEGVLTIAKVDVDSNPAIAGTLGIRSIPTLVLFKEGQPVDQIVGFRPKGQIVKQLSKHVEGLTVSSSS
jgi:thioredoxin 1